MLKKYVNNIDDFLVEISEHDPYGITEVINSNEMQQIKALGYSVISSPLQLKNGTLTVFNRSLNIQFIFYFKTGYIRKRQGIKGRLTVMYANDPSPEFGKLATDFIIKKIDHHTGNLSKTSLKDKKSALKDFITEKIDSLGLTDSALRSILIGCIKNKNNINEASNIIKDLDKCVIFENGVLNLSFSASKLINIDFDKILSTYHGDTKIYLNYKKYIDRTFYESKNKNIKATVFQAASLGIRYAKSKDREVIVLSVLSEPNVIDDDFDIVLDSTENSNITVGGNINQLNHIYIDISSHHNIINLDFKVPILYVYYSEHSKNNIIKTDIPISNIRFLSTLRNDNGTRASLNYDLAVPYNEQYTIKVLKLDGSAVDDDHSDNISIHHAMNDMF